ncbi:LOW QUALITY PROTEIN: telomerase reverse transcriptase-like [Bidens hawaiensis]|uniref:LOW QUALITY PROTEIN: telomerase reverse transcriptase-like n=1 Tax=Bidens hawaiensis TaxID=980011 RepID=UPI00404B149B
MNGEKTRRKRVPEVLWKLFKNRAATLAQTILSLLPPQTQTTTGTTQCYCKRSSSSSIQDYYYYYYYYCLHCCQGDRMPFLLREDDPPDYRNLLHHCFLVLPDNAPSPPPSLDYHSRYPQLEIVRRTIEMILSENNSSKNVICTGYNKRTRSSIVVEALASPSWSLLSKRVGDALMVYILKYSSIFIPLNKKKHNQVAGTAIIDLCWKHLKRTSKSKNQQRSLGVIDRAGSVTMNTATTKSCHEDDQENGVQSRKRSRSHASKRKRKRRKLSSCDTKSSLPQEKMCSCCARTLEETLLSLIPPPATGQCCCKGSSRDCLRCQGDRMSFLLREDDPPDYHNLFDHCIVVLSENVPSPPPFDYHSRYPQVEIVRRTIEMILSENNSSKNVICTGYNKRTRSSIVVEALASPSWSLLLKRIGDALMVYLLKYSSIFISLNEKKHNQVAGTAIIDLCLKHLERTSQSKNQQQSLGVFDKASSVTMNIATMKSCHEDSTMDVDLSKNNQENGVQYRKRSRSHASRRKRTRRKLSSHDTKSCLTQDKMCSCCSLWQKLWKGPAENQINKRPMLYKLERSLSVLPGKHIINHLRPNVSGANALFKDIFDVCSAVQPTQCSHTNGTCAIRTACPYHSLHKQLRVLIRKAIHCPRVKILNKHALDQHSIDVSTSTTNVASFCSQRQVESFVWAACMNIIPRELLGNWRILRKNISKFIRLRIYEKFSLHQCMYKLKLSEFPLLCNSRDLLARWIHWLFASVVVPLLQANFYVTEGEHGKLQVFFYEKSVWEKLTVGCLKYDCYSLVNKSSVKQILNSRRFGFSRVRFRPKANGIRPLANLKSSSRLAGKEYKAVNVVLQDLHVALKDVQKKNPEKLGSSVFSYNEVHENLRNFLSRIKNGSEMLPCVYMVVADVQKAYDSISQDKLLHLMKDVIVDDHLLHDTQQIIASKRHFQVIPYVNSCKRFRSGAQNRSSHGVTVDQGTRRTATKNNLWVNLQQHVKNNLLCMDKQFYLQNVGIPQGSILSSLLCSFYYGHMENCKLVPFLNKVIKSDSERSDESSDFMLLRFIDDFLFISTSKKLALGFLSRLERGFCEYNCNMKKEKFGLSFDFDKIKSKSNMPYVYEDGNKFLPWSGLFVNCKTLEVQADYTRYLDSHLRSTLTVCWQGDPGQHFRKKMCDYLRPKCHVIFFDSNINSASVVRLNIHQVFLLCAMKFHCYACHLSDVCSFDSGAYFDIIRNSLRYMYRLMKRRAYCMHGIRPILKVKRWEVEWLGLTAYIEVLKRKQSRYSDLLYLLESELELKSGNVKSPDLKFAVDKSNSSVLWKIKY